MKSDIFSLQESEKNKTQDQPKIRNSLTLASNIFKANDQKQKQLVSNKITPTFTSNIFGDPIKPKLVKTYSVGEFIQNDSPLRVKAKDLTTEQLLGDYKEQGVKKPIPKKFEPKHKEYDYQKQRYKEFYNIDYDPSAQKNLQKEENQERPQTVQERKAIDLASNIFTQSNKTISYNPQEKLSSQKQKWSDVTQDGKKRLSQQGLNENITAYQQKQAVFSSQIKFGEDKAQCQNISQQEKVRFTQQDDSNLEERKKDHNYSDLFGMKSGLKQDQKTIEKTTIKSSQKSLDVFSKNDNNKKENGEMYNAFECRQKNLQSSLSSSDWKQHQQKISEKNQFENEKKQTQKSFEINESTTTKNLKQQELQSINEKKYEGPVTHPHIFDFQINGLNNQFNQDQFQNFCKQNGYHIFDFQLEQDTITLNPKGTGRIKIRSHQGKDLLKVKEMLQKQGIESTPFIKQNSKKTGKYEMLSKTNWTDPHLAKEEKRLNEQVTMNAKERKMRDLESEGDRFGNSEGVGKFGNEWKAQKLKQEKLPPSNKKEVMSQSDYVKNAQWKKAINSQPQLRKRSNNQKTIKTETSNTEISNTENLLPKDI